MKSFQFHFKANFDKLVGTVGSSNVNFTEILPGWRNANGFQFSSTQQENMLWINRTIVLKVFSVIIIEQLRQLLGT